MSCNCGCYCGYCGGIDCYSKPCYSCGCKTTTSTTTTTTINPNCEPCDEFYDCECVIYNGDNIECYGLKTGDNLCSILETIIENLPECKTTLPPFDCTFSARVINTTPTTTSTSTTTTTCPPEEFIMEAFGVYRVTLGLLYSSEAFRIDWGDGTVDSYAPGNWSNAQLDHIYSTAYTGPVKVISCNLSGISRFIDSNQATGGFCGGHMTIQATELGKLTGATWIEVIAQTVQGNVIDLPRSLTKVVIWGGDHIANAPGWTCSHSYDSSQGTTITGDVADLPPLLINTSIRGLNTIYGVVADIPRAGNLTGNYSFALGGNNVLTGNIIDLPVSTNPANNDYIEIGGWNTVTGDIADIPNTYAQVWIDGKKSSSNVPGATGNTLTGNISTLPTYIQYFHVWGNNTITGNINGINTYHNTLKYINIAGGNTISGTIQSVQCENIAAIEVFGNNTISGSITGLRADSHFDNLTTIEIQGKNTIGGALSGIPLLIKNFLITSSTGGGSGLTGAISDLSILSDLEAFGTSNVSNSLTGDLADFPAKVKEVFIYQNAGGINTYTGGVHTWANPMGYFNVVTPLSFNQATTDLILSELDIPSSQWSIRIVSGHPVVKLKSVGPTGGNSNPDVVSLASKVGGLSYISFV